MFLTIRRGNVGSPPHIAVFAKEGKKIRVLGEGC